MKPLLLELFAGTGSVGKVATMIGFEVISVDMDPKAKATYTSDILNWDYKQIPCPDFIWASPPCNTFSTMNYFAHKGDRDTRTAKPLTHRAQMGTDILYRTLDIIEYFMKLNPNLFFCIENPRAMMRRDERMLSLPYCSVTSYNQYNDEHGRYKPTNFWTNYKIELKPVIRPKLVNTIRYMSRSISYQIPPDLITAILSQTKFKYLLKYRSTPKNETDF